MKGWIFWNTKINNSLWQESNIFDSAFFLLWWKSYCQRSCEESRETNSILLFLHVSVSGRQPHCLQNPIKETAEGCSSWSTGGWAPSPRYHAWYVWSQYCRWWRMEKVAWRAHEWWCGERRYVQHIVAYWNRGILEVFPSVLGYFLFLLLVVFLAGSIILFSNTRFLHTVSFPHLLYRHLWDTWS